MGTLDLFQRTAQEEEQGELGLQTTQSQVDEKVAELRQWLCNEVANHFEKEIKHFLSSGAVDTEEFVNAPFILGRIVLERAASDFRMMSPDAKRLRKNLQHF